MKHRPSMMRRTGRSATMPGGVFALRCLGADRSTVDNLRERLDTAASGSLACDGHAVDVHLAFGMADAADEPELSIDDLLWRSELAVGDTRRRQKRKWAWHAAADAEHGLAV